MVSMQSITSTDWKPSVWSARYCGLEVTEDKKNPCYGSMVYMVDFLCSFIYACPQIKYTTIPVKFHSSVYDPMAK